MANFVSHDLPLLLAVVALALPGDDLASEIVVFRLHAEHLAANNYADSLVKLQHFEEARSLLREMVPVAQRVLGEHDVLTLYMKMHHAEALYEDGGATLDDLREAVTTLEETARIARRVLGSAHPNAMKIEQCLQKSRAALRAREETQPSAGSA